MSTIHPMPLDNPYWDAVQKFPPSMLNDFGGENGYEPTPFLRSMVREGKTWDEVAVDYDLTFSRDWLTRLYAFSIPNDQAVTEIADLLDRRPIIEIGAGRGYWAWMLTQAGHDVVAYDQSLIADGDSNGWHDLPIDDRTVYHPIARGGPSDAYEHPHRVLFLSWPPQGGKMDADSLTAFTGDTLLYVGETDGGCCGSRKFFNKLRTEWDAEHYVDLPRWGGIRDIAVIYRKRA